ncbi:MAG: endonuclease/exonuclease/phosphatase family protein [Gammaproteobacteria bacterium]|nr:endonuclease/exonuclease/phosphatase family protein [Gammaproteobacteria bacterium]
MRLWICASILLVGCTDADDGPRPASPLQVVGYLESKALRETSGLARSQRRDGLLWAINDDGPADLHGINTRGDRVTRIRLAKTNNRDWEDLASFSLGGEAYLVVADIGDNDRDRNDVTLHIVEEPDIDEKKIKVEWRIDFTYPEGPRDAEAIAVDAAAERIFVLSKRDIPARLYALPLKPDTDDTIIAEYVGVVGGLPQPSRRDVNDAPLTGDWHWQPTGMDFAGDGSGALILTYRAMYYFARNGHEPWLDALQRAPLGLRLARYPNAESIAFGQDDEVAFITTEKTNAPLLRVDLSAARRHSRTADATGASAAITIMTFNVQNLFDNTDDPGKDDKAYLPLAAKQNEAHVTECNTIEVESWRNECLYLDWSDAAIEHKLGVVADTIKQVNDGRGADIIAFQEVENAAILNRLRDEFLTDSAYEPAILIEGQDVRGIDVAFLSRLPLAEPAVLHPLTFEDFADREGDTRGVLQATFELPDGSFITGFAVHFPAPFHPTAMREAAYRHLNELRAKLPDTHHVFAAGDFNTTSSEDNEQRMLERFARPTWSVAHDFCTGCPGTHYYARDDSWSFLDMILYAAGRGEKTTWRIRADSVRIANANPAQVQDPGIPFRYNAAGQTGVSDHWPLIVTFEPAKKQ